eukprot:UC1_evm1s1662
MDSVVITAAFDPSGDNILGSTFEGQLQLVRVNNSPKFYDNLKPSLDEREYKHRGSRKPLAFCKSTSLLASCGVVKDATTEPTHILSVMLWNVQSRTLQGKFDIEEKGRGEDVNEKVNDLAWSCKGKYLAVACVNKLDIFHSGGYRLLSIPVSPPSPLQSTSPPPPLSQLPEEAHAVAFSSRIENRLAVGTGPTVYLWSIEESSNSKATRIAQFDGYARSISRACLRFSPDDDCLVSASSSTLRIFNVSQTVKDYNQSGIPKTRDEEDGNYDVSDNNSNHGNSNHVNCLTFADGKTSTDDNTKTLAVGCSSWVNDTVQLLSIKKTPGKTKFEVEMVREISMGKLGEVTHIAFGRVTRDVAIMATLCRENIVFWDIGKFKSDKQNPPSKIAVLDAGTSSFDSMASHQSGYLAAGTTEGVQLFDSVELFSSAEESLPIFPTFAIGPTAREDINHPDKDHRSTLEKYPQSLLKCQMEKDNEKDNESMEKEGNKRKDNSYKDERETLPLLAWAASDKSRIEYLQAFEKIDLPSLDGELASQVLDAALCCQDAKVIERVLDLLVKAARKRDAFVDKPADQDSWLLAINTITQELTCRVVYLIDKHPDRAARFLRKLGLVRCRTDYDFYNFASLSKINMVVKGFNSGAVKDLRSNPPAAKGKKTYSSDVQCLYRCAEPYSFWYEELILTKEQQHKTKEQVPVEARVVPLPGAAGFIKKITINEKESSASLLEALVRARRADLFDNAIARAVVQFKWKKYGRRRHQWAMAYYIIELALHATISFTADWSIDQRVDVALQNIPLSSYYVATLALTLLASVLVLYDVYHEAKEVYHFGRFYFTENVWNYLDLSTIALSLSYSALFLMGSDFALPCLATGLYLRWIGMLYYLQAEYHMGQVVRMILAIMWEIRYFMVIMALTIVGAWSSFHLLLLDISEWGSLDPLRDPANGLLIMFNLLIMGDFDMDTYTGPNIILARVTFVLSMIFVPVVVLNLLIAFMGTIYERVEEKSELEYLALKASIIYKYEVYLSKSDRTDIEKFPEWLHVLVPGHTSYDTSSEIDALKSKMKDLQEQLGKTENSTLSDEIGALKSEMKDVQEQLGKTANTDLSNGIGALKSGMKALQEQLGKTENSTLSDEIGALKSEMKALQKQPGKTENSTLSDEIGALKSEMKTLQEQLGKTANTDLGDEISTLKSDMKTLQELLAKTANINSGLHEKLNRLVISKVDVGSSDGSASTTTHVHVSEIAQLYDHGIERDV